MPTNHALTIASTVDSLIGAFRSHLLGRSLPAPAYVHLDVVSREVSVQPPYGADLAATLGNLLLWAHTLSEVTAEWWHTRSGNLHVTVHGRTLGGLELSVYNGADFDECTDLVHLAVDQSEGVSLDELYALACLLRENRPEEVAP